MRKAQANNEPVTTVFFIVEKAHDLTWRHAILKDLMDAVIAGRMYNFIRNFLKPRSFEVKINEVLFDTKSQTVGFNKED